MHLKKNKLGWQFWILLNFCLFAGQLFRWQLTANLAIYVHDLLLAIFVGCNWLIISQRQQLLKFLRHLVKNNWVKSGLIWIGGGWMLAGITGQNLIYPLLYLIKYLTYGLAFFNWWLIYRQLGKYQKITWQRVLLFSLSLIFLVGLGQYLLVPDTRFLASEGWDPHYYRLQGFFFDPNFMGMILVMFLTFSLFTNWSKILPFLPVKLTNWLIIFFNSLIVIGISLTFSRSSYLSLLIVLALNCWPKPWQIFKEIFQPTKWGTFLSTATKINLFYLAVFLVMTLLSPKPGGEGVNLARTATITSRLENSQTDLTSLTPSQLIIGRGLFVPQPATAVQPGHPQHAHFADNILVFWFSGTGLVGLILFSAGLISLIKSHSWSTASQILTLAIFSHSLFNLTIWESFNLITYGLIMIALSSASSPKKIVANLDI